MRTVLIVLLCATLLYAQPKDRTFYEHKAGHFVICFGITWGATKLDHPKMGLAISMGLGLAKELHDVKHGENQMSLRRDLCIDAVGALAGYWLGRKPTRDKPLAFNKLSALEIERASYATH